MSSGLLTPTDLSPARAQFDTKAPDAASALSTTSSSSLLFEQHANQLKLAEALEAGAANFRYGLPRSSSSNISLFQPFSEQPTPASYNHSHNYNLNTLLSNSSSSSLSQSIYSSPLPRRVDANRLPQMDWRLTQQPVAQQSAAILNSDWCIPSEKSTLDFNNLNQLDHAEPVRTAIAHHQQQQPPSLPQPAQTSHEVSFLTTRSLSESYYNRLK